MRRTSFGSGRYPRRHRRTTVEECLAEFDVDQLVGRRGCWAGAPVSGELQWGVNDTAVRFALARDDDLRLTLAVEYTVEVGGVAEEIAEVIRFTAITLGSGGRKLYFVCPRCGDRRSKLYIPPGRAHIGCRGCYDLTNAYAQRHDHRVVLLRRDPERLKAILARPEEYSESERYLALRAVAGE